jgi:hypothetical protein
MKRRVQPSDEKTKVIFRRWPKKQYGEVLALFPDMREGLGLCTSYAHIGQHSISDYHHVLRLTTPADIEDGDVQALVAELTQIGYNLDVRRRYQWKR